MHIYEKLFAEYGQTTAQVLLTKENSVRHNQYTNSRNALLTLLHMGIIPIVNENDAIAVDELKIGDNDTLSATVATLVDADVLVILSDIEGLYSANPQQDKNARLLAEIPEITPEIERIAGGAGSQLGTGGMSFNNADGHLRFISIPRDTLTEIPGRKEPERINAAYSYGGPALTMLWCGSFSS